MSERPTDQDEPIDRSLIDAARPAMGPDAAQRSRLKRAVLAAAVGSAAAGTAAVASGTGATSAAGVGVGAKIAVAVFALAAIGGGAWWMSAEATDAPGEDVVEPTLLAPSPDAHVSSDAAPAEVIEDDAGVDASVEALAEAPPEITRPVRRPDEAVEARDEPDLVAIERETELLREAHAASRRGDARAALALLDEHARRFPRGMLTSERSGLRVLALCDAGEVAQARTEASRFLASSPPSGLAERVRRSCAAEP